MSSVWPYAGHAQSTYFYSAEIWLMSDPRKAENLRFLHVLLVWGVTLTSLLIKSVKVEALS
jgi:hypothetical protein